MASSIGAIKKQIQRDAQLSTNESRDKINIVLHENVEGYHYGGKIPLQYIWTDTLIDAANVTPVSGGGNSYEFKAEMDGERISYSTGRPLTGSEVVEATEEGGYGTIGSHGYWKKTEAEIPNIVDAAFSKRFG